MIKVLINLGSILVCLGILAFGGYQTVQTMNIDGMIGDFEEAIESTPLFPDAPDSPDNPGNPTTPDSPTGDSIITVPDGSDAILDPDTTVELDQVEEELSDSVHTQLDGMAGEGLVADVLGAYDIELMLDGTSVQPGGIITVTLDIPETATEYESLQVVYIDDNGNVFPCETTVNEDGTISFLTDHFSRYAIVGFYHQHEFVEGKCQCGETDPDYVPPHKHKFVEGKCECGEVNPNYIPPHVHQFVEGECACGESDPNYIPPHVHAFVEGVCACGEVNPDYVPVPDHTHSFVDGKCECGDSDPNYVPPHKHAFVEGKCECGEINPDYVPPHVHEFVEGECQCGESDPNYVPHVHNFVSGKCACGETDPNYKAPGLSNEEAKDSFANMYDSYDPEFEELNKEFFMGMVSGALGTNKPIDKHTHSFVDGKCECGEEDPNYIPPHKHTYVDGKCECGEEDPYYTPEAPEHSHVFVDGKCVCGESDPTYVPPHVHKFVEGVCECGEIDPNYSDEPSFDDDFNPDEFIPEEAPEDGTTSSETVNDLIVDVAGTYFDKLQEGIKENQQANSDATEEEQAAARDEFVQKESEAFAGLLNIVTKPEESTETELVESVDALLGSSVCLGTVTESIEKNDTLTSTVQDATSNLDVATKKDIQQKIEEQLAANPENEKQYNDLANLFGITLGSEIVIPGEGELPEGFDPSQLPG